MQLWFARGSQVSIREQLVTQVVLGILGDDLAPGLRLPSTRELALRTATENACAQISSGVTDSNQCANTPPDSVRWPE